MQILTLIRGKRSNAAWQAMHNLQKITAATPEQILPVLWLRLSLLLLLLSSLISCGEDRATTTQDNVETTKDAVAIYNIGNGDIPFPNIAVYSTSDYTLNIPGVNPADYSNPKVAMNASWGFSTNAPISFNFSEAIKSGSETGAVKVYRLLFNPADQAQSASVLGAVLSDPVSNCGSALASLSSPNQFVTSLSGTHVIVSPTQVLSPNSFYLVLATDQLSTQNDTPFKPDYVYKLLQGSDELYNASSGSLIGIAPNPADAAALEQLRQLTNLTEALAKICDGGAIGANNIIASTVFYTAPTDLTKNPIPGLTMLQAAQAIVPSTVPSQLSNIATSTPGNLADIYVGTVDLPYYLHKASSPGDKAVLSEFWHNNQGSFPVPLNPIPVPTTTVSVPVLMTVPKGVAKASLSGVVIFQHGITSSRAALLGIADALAKAGYVAVAIDLPLHGIKADDLTWGGLYQANNERHFDLDLDGDGVVDNSGDHYINLANLLVTRDNVQQSVADLFALHKAIASMDYDYADPSGDVGPDFGGKDVYFIGHSLGAIVGIPFFALDTTIKSAVLGMPGGALPKVLDGSAAFGQIIADGLRDHGVIKGTADYEGFMLATQTVLDVADPINFAAQLSTDNRGILGYSVHNDLVVPNLVPDYVSPAGTVPAPLAGTYPLFQSMGLQRLDSNTSAMPLHAWVEFGENLDGSRVCSFGGSAPTQIIHATLLSPYDQSNNLNAVTASVMTEMQAESVEFLASAGTSLVVNDTTYMCAP